MTKHSQNVKAERKISFKLVSCALITAHKINIRSVLISICIAYSCGRMSAKRMRMILACIIKKLIEGCNPDTGVSRSGWTERQLIKC